MCYCIVIDLSYIMYKEPWRRNKSTSKSKFMQVIWGSFVIILFLSVQVQRYQCSILFRNFITFLQCFTLQYFLLLMILWFIHLYEKITDLIALISNICTLTKTDFHACNIVNIFPLDGHQSQS
jgi:hypothetical protein